MMTTFTDVVFYIIYVLLLMGISNEVGGKLSYLQTQNVKDILPVRFVHCCPLKLKGMTDSYFIFG